MATNSIIKTVQDQISSNALTFSTAMGLTAAEVTAIQTAMGLAGALTVGGIQVGNTTVGVNGDTLTITDASLTLFGSATPATVSMSFGLNDAKTALTYTLEFAMPSTWSFGTGFPILDIFPFNAFTFKYCI